MQAVPVVVAVVTPRSRSRIEIIVREVVSAGFWTKTELGTGTPVTPWRCSSCCAGVLNRSAQITSLATNRWVCEAMRLPAPGTIFFVEPSRANASARPDEAARAELERLDHVLVDLPQRPRRPHRLALLDELLLLAREAAQVALEVGELDPGLVTFVSIVLPERARTACRSP